MYVYIYVSNQAVKELRNAKKKKKKSKKRKKKKKKKLLVDSFLTVLSQSQV